MTEDQDLDHRIARLRRASETIEPPLGLEQRILARVERESAGPSRLSLAFCRRALVMAALLAVIASAAAYRSAHRLESAALAALLDGPR